MFGAVLVAIALLIVIPVSVIMSGGVLAGVISYFVQADVDPTHEGSEILDLHG